MKSSFIVFLLGLLLGAGAFWYFTEGQKKESVREAQDDLSRGANKMKESVKESVKETFGDINADDVKDELARTGKVVREKTKKAGDAMAHMAANASTTAAVKAALIAEPGLSALAIDVDTSDGLVTLSGTVSSHDEIAKAVKVAMGIQGVEKVVSTLQVKPK